MKTCNAKRVASALLKTNDDWRVVERACLAGYIAEKGLSVPSNSDLNGYLAHVPEEAVARCRKIIRSSLDGALDIERLIEIFEFFVSGEDRKKNGVAYTPYAVKSMMLERVLAERTCPTVFDPSCGCAAFLLTAAKMIHEKSGRPLAEVVSTCIFGSDIDAHALERTNALFALLLVENGESDCAKPRLFNLDMLEKDSVASIRARFPKGFNCVIGNPPYVRFRNMDDATQARVNSWTVSSCGNADLYMPFFEVGMSLLAADGILAYITSNTYLQSLNGRCLRQWCAAQGLNVEITDFRDAQLFANVTCYTCVTFLRRDGKLGISYRRASDPSSAENRFSFYPFAAFPGPAPWRMRSPEIDDVIRKLETTGRPLSQYCIRNGLATLSNDVFFFRPVAEDMTFFTREYGGKRWKIERAICRKVIKPNVLHCDADLEAEMEFAIFPYVLKDGKYIIRDEREMREKFPSAYAFLSACRERLATRDKGKGDYPAWYAYGRTQGMNGTGKKLLIPYIAGAPTAVLSLDEDLLFYCGYALLLDDEDELRYLKCFLESEAFWYFVYQTSKPYSKGFMSFAKNYIVRFSIPQLDVAARKRLLEERSPARRNALVWKAFGVRRASANHRANMV